MKFREIILTSGMMLGGFIFLQAQQPAAPQKVTSNLSPEGSISPANSVSNAPANNNLPQNVSNVGPVDPNATPETPSGNIPSQTANLNPDSESNPKKD